MPTGLRPLQTQAQNLGCARGVAPRHRRVPVPTQHCAGESLLAPQIQPPRSPTLFLCPRRLTGHQLLASGFQWV